VIGKKNTARNIFSGWISFRLDCRSIHLDKNKAERPFRVVVFAASTMDGIV